MICEWEVLSDDAPRAAKRKYQDLEQRSANEHELLNYLRTLPEADFLSVTTRLRGGCSTDDLLLFARELSSNSSGGRRMLIAIRQQATAADETHQDSHVGPDSEQDQSAGEIHPRDPTPRPTLPPLASIWYTISLPVYPTSICIELNADVDELGTSQKTRFNQSSERPRSYEVKQHQNKTKPRKTIQNVEKHNQ